MEIEIICWRTREKIIFDNIKGAFQDVCNKEDEIYYYNLENHKVKIINTNSDEKNFCKKYINKVYDKKNTQVIILKEVNNENISIIKSSIDIDNATIIVGNISLSENIIQENKNILNKLVYIPQLSNGNDEIDIKVILHILLRLHDKNSNNIDEILGTHIIVGVEKEKNILGSIPLYILKRFNYICSFNEFELSIINEKELDLNELIYIEDPLKEYMKYDDVLIIKQYPSHEKDGRSYFYMIAK